ncbi:hypothetical protein [Virgibacillus siamensis]|uniref:hypothetical protein n=1 Tax=Virgibacillus siamensis TaxID=480071 RepID=UPI000986E13C|nr:hypothetical protein [Virgibacillus siamensis]
MFEVSSHNGYFQGNELLCISVSGMKVVAFGEEMIHEGPRYLRVPQDSLTVGQLTQLYGLLENSNGSAGQNISKSDQINQLNMIMGMLNNMNQTSSKND